VISMTCSPFLFVLKNVQTSLGITENHPFSRKNTPKTPHTCLSSQNPFHGLIHIDFPNIFWGFFSPILVQFIVQIPSSIDGQTPQFTGIDAVRRNLIWKSRAAYLPRSPRNRTHCNKNHSSGHPLGFFSVRMMKNLFPGKPADLLKASSPVTLPESVTPDYWTKKFHKISTYAPIIRLRMPSNDHPYRLSD